MWAVSYSEGAAADLPIADVTRPCFIGDVKRYKSFFRLLLGNDAGPNHQLEQISAAPLKSIKIDRLSVVEDLHCWPPLKFC